MSTGLSLNDYQKLAMRTAKVDLNFKDHLTHAALGLGGDAGEFSNAIRDHVIYGKILDVANCIEELGDVLWFVQYAASNLGLSLEEIARFNLDKLRERYPDTYSDQDAILRRDKRG